MEMEKLKKKRIIQIGNFLVPILCFILLGIFSLGQGNYEDVFTNEAYPKILNAAPITFAIWGLIFFFLALYVFYQGRDLFRTEKLEIPCVFDVSLFFILSTIAVSFWYFFWVEGMILVSVAMMFFYLICNLIVYLRLDINRKKRPLKEHFFVITGWSLYAGWVSIATIVNATTGFVAIDFSTPIINEVGWTIIILLMTLLIFLGVIITRDDIIFGAVGWWAILGIIIERFDPSTVFYIEIVITAFLGLFILSGVLIYKLIKRDWFRKAFVKN